jgi:hypothetical protein
MEGERGKQDAPERIERIPHPSCSTCGLVVPQPQEQQVHRPRPAKGQEVEPDQGMKTHPIEQPIGQGS